MLVLGLVFICLGQPLSVLAGGKGNDKDIDVDDVSATVNESDKSAEVFMDVTNNGDDFGGYVRLVLDNGNSRNHCVYERYVAIASGETETVSIRFPIPESNGTIEECSAMIKVLDSKGKELYSARERGLFDFGASQQFGMLTSAGNGLDYLDKAFDNLGMYGYGYGYYNGNVGSNWDGLYLMNSELTDGRTLRQMSFLFIDDVKLSSFSDEAIDAIEEWTRMGGILVIGTGAGLDETFDAFNPSFIDAKLASNKPQSTFSYYSINGYVTVADITYGNSYTTTQVGLSGDFRYRNEGRGKIVLLPYSMSDQVLDQSYFADMLISEIMALMNTGSNGAYSQTLTDYDLGISYGVMQGRSSFSPTGLRIVILIYVILVGPGIYLILKKLNKREKIWIAIPILSLFFIFLVFLVSRGFSMRSRQYTSIRMAPADGKNEETDILMGFSANNKSWTVTLEDDADAAGPLIFPSRYASEDRDAYVCSVTTAGTQLHYLPESGYDSAYFRIKMPNSVKAGGMDADIRMENSKLVGSFENNTDYDFDHVLVVCYGYYDILDDVKKGDSININSKSRQRYNNENEINDLAKRYYDRHEYEEAKLFMSMYFAAHELNENACFIVGVRKGDQKLLKGNIAEERFLCVYSVE